MTLSIKAGWTVQLNHIVFLYPTGVVTSLSSEIEISDFCGDA